ncbi:MAG: M48 family metallopeptidase [Clostridia bacterium]|nr:M48 family metallopeptidase [Clostridia bacterium]
MSNRKIDIRITQAKRKSIKMTVLSDGTVSVEAPDHMSKEGIMAFIDSKKSWIVSKVTQRLATGHCYNAPEGIDGTCFSYLGRECRLKINAAEGLKDSVTLRNGILIVTHKNNHPDEILEIIEAWFRQKTQEEVAFWLKCYQPHFSQQPNRVVIKEQRKRWGSCSSKMNLNFNWRLSMLPTWVVSYIVLHELCHFEEMNHSDRFWKAVEMRMPEYDKARQWLKQNSHRFLPE